MRTPASGVLSPRRALGQGGLLCVPPPGVTGNRSWQGWPSFLLMSESLSSGRKCSNASTGGAVTLLVIITGGIVSPESHVYPEPQDGTLFGNTQ